MPHFRIETNILRNKISDDFPKKIIALIAKELGKPLERCRCTVVPDAWITVGDDDSCQPAATGHLSSIGQVGPNENPRIAKTLSELVVNELGLEQGRFMMTFQDQMPHNVAIGKSCPP